MRFARSSTERSASPVAAGEDGSASVEFLTAGLLLLIPVIALVLALGSIQSAAYAVEGAARQAARVFVQESSVADARAAADRAVRVTLADYGVDPGAARVVISCSPDPRNCLSPRGRVTVTVSASATLPLFPPILGVDAPLSVPLEARATEQVSRFGGVR